MGVVSSHALGIVMQPQDCPEGDDVQLRACTRVHSRGHDRRTSIMAVVNCDSPVNREGRPLPRGDTSRAGGERDHVSTDRVGWLCCPAMACEAKILLRITDPGAV